MEMNVIRTNRDTRSPAKLGSVGGLVVVPDEDDVKGSTGLGAESTSRQQNAPMSLIDSHKSDPPSTTTLVVPSSNSCQVFDSPAPANGSTRAIDARIINFRCRSRQRRCCCYSGIIDEQITYKSLFLLHLLVVENHHNRRWRRLGK